MFRWLCGASLLFLVAAMSTTKSHRQTREPNETESFKFNYDRSTHEIAVSTGHVCYIFTLSEGERTAVHTDIGMRTLELKFLGMIGTATKTEVLQADLDRHLIHACGTRGINTYYMMTAV